jgi:hypothetical protein
MLLIILAKLFLKCNKYIPASFAMLAYEAQMETHSHYAKGKYTDKINEHQLRYGKKKISLWTN